MRESGVSFSSSIVVLVLPSLRISGGILEALRLAEDLRSRGADVRIMCLWNHPHPVHFVDFPVRYLTLRPPTISYAAFAMPLLMWRYSRYLSELRSATNREGIAVILTHYSTLPFGWFTPPPRRYCFVQGVEWMFVSEGWFRSALRRFIVSSYSRSRIVVANAYLHNVMCSAGIVPIAQASVWADPFFADCQMEHDRPVDVALVLRRGQLKRLDLYLKLLAVAATEPRLSCAVITTEDDIAAMVRGVSIICLLRPEKQEMRDLYLRSKLFVLLSDHEGFGLPPLEAMGAGCVPVCRDSGGVRCYMKNGLKGNLIPLETPVEAIMEHIRGLISNEKALQELSTEARSIFMRGLSESEQSRKTALELLSRM